MVSIRGPSFATHQHLLCTFSVRWDSMYAAGVACVCHCSLLTVMQPAVDEDGSATNVLPSLLVPPPHAGVPIVRQEDDEEG